MDLEGYIGFFGPAGMPPAVVARVNAALQKAMEVPAVNDLILQSGNVPAGGSAAKFAELVSHQFDAWGAVIRTIGLKLD